VAVNFEEKLTAKTNLITFERLTHAPVEISLCDRFVCRLKSGIITRS